VELCNAYAGLNFTAYINYDAACKLK